MTKDPVCGMIIEAEMAPAQVTYNGTEYYFCSTECRDKFVKAPKRYADEATAKPPYMKKVFTARGSGAERPASNR